MNFVVLRHRRKVSTLCLLPKICHRVDHHMSEYLHHFVAARITRASAAMGELPVVLPSCRADQFSQSFLPCCLTSVELAAVGRV